MWYTIVVPSCRDASPYSLETTSYDYNQLVVDYTLLKKKKKFKFHSSMTANSIRHSRQYDVQSTLHQESTRIV